MEEYIINGLNDKEVKNRYERNLVNYDTSLPTKSVKRIILDNVFTLFNLLNLVLGLCIFVTGSYKNMLFLGLVICNTLISIIQEIRSKRTIDKLSLLVEKSAIVIRNGKENKIDINEIVKDDLILFKIGNQIIVDSTVIDGSVEVDESCVTGESNPIYKQSGDLLLSGSYVISGKCKAKVLNVGIDNYSSRISCDAKYVKKVNSEIMKSLNKIIKLLSIAIVPIAILLFLNQYYLTNSDINISIINTVAALISMIPEGLVLLTSTVLAVSVIKLSRYNVLVQQLYCIETLARVDTICFDKTGTLTEGRMEVKEYINLSKEDERPILSEMCACLDDNATIDAIKNKYGTSSNFKVEEIIPFSSLKKYSAVTFKDKGTYILGAAEFILKSTKEIDKYLEKYSKENRVILFAHSKEKVINKNIPKNIEVLGLILIQDKVKKESKKLIDYFKKQGVDVKIISGDNPETINSVASLVGIDTTHSVDMSKVNFDNVKNYVDYSIYGRVTPEQKKEIIKSLKETRTVAYVGDGVNDVLALKEADCSVSFLSGSDAARTVSELILMDSNLDSMPVIVDEGRRTINNVERSSSLFIVKTIYATILAVLFIFINQKYPFIPIQLTLISALTIGIPSFVLALEPNYEKISGNFLINIFSKAFPTALTIVINILVTVIVGNLLNLTDEQISTLSVILIGFVGFMHIYLVSKPLNLLRSSLLIVLVSIFMVGIVGLRNLFSLTFITPYLLLLTTLLLGLTLLIFVFMTNIFHKYIYKFIKKISDKK
ncbi:MAG: HAD-IC family P-type ATPase [Clostridium sp.]|nr:HAD-IC family P-type ATPase [Clostridium sp.]MCM1444550.1 HAD-IC family P-type ATPase [Candidatus Amulumruptor caecigallinarius]